MITAFDVLLIVVAIITMLAGLARRRSLWKGGKDHKRPGDLWGLLGYLAGHRKILKNPTAGVAHILLFWGLVIPLMVIILAQFHFTIPYVSARLLSLMTDILGTLMLAGILFFLIRRLRSPNSEKPKRTLLPVLALLFVTLTGFLAEGSRLSIVHPSFSGISPMGSIFSFLLPNSPRFMQLMIRFHFLGVLFFMAILPFTFMRHLPAAALNVYYKRQGEGGDLNKVSLDEGPVGASAVTDLNWKQLLDAEACVACGRCEENCPAALSGKPLSPRKVMRNILEQMENRGRKGPGSGSPPSNHLADDITQDEIWSCTTCMACVEHCPLFIEPMEKIIEMRRHLVMGRDMLPAEARPVIRNLEIFGDVQGKGSAYRADWALNRQVPILSDRDSSPEILLWIGCSGAFHPGYQDVSRAMVKILRAADVKFAILGKEELCCGDPARRLGEEALFMDLFEKNMRRFSEYGIQKILTLCPHCFNTLKNEYPVLGGYGRSHSMIGFEVVHAVEFVAGLIRGGRIRPKYPVDGRVTLHDPCYLGRFNHIYRPLRDTVKAIPGVELVELGRSRERSFCCGGGGGRMWLHEHLGRKMNQIRSEEIMSTAAGVVGTACPYCRTMLEDGVKSLDMENPPKIFDVIELVASSLG